MSNKPSMRRSFSVVASLAALSGLAFVLAFSVSDSQAATERGGEAETTAVSKGPKAEAESYAIEMKATGPYQAGKEGSVEIAIAAKGDYHINDKYPIKFKVTDPAPEGVKYPKLVLKREDGVFEEKKGSMKIPFVAANAGKAKVSGVLSVSMCSASSCLMEKVELDLDVDVK